MHSTLIKAFFLFLVGATDVLAAPRHYAGTTKAASLADRSVQSDPTSLVSGALNLDGNGNGDNGNGNVNGENGIDNGHNGNYDLSGNTIVVRSEEGSVMDGASSLVSGALNGNGNGNGGNGNGNTNGLNGNDNGHNLNGDLSGNNIVIRAADGSSSLLAGVLNGNGNGGGGNANSDVNGGNGNNDGNNLDGDLSGNTVILPISDKSS